MLKIVVEAEITAVGRVISVLSCYVPGVNTSREAMVTELRSV